MDNLKEKLKKIPKTVWILLIIVLIGIFLRTYHFREWLDLGDDQVHDAILVDNVVSGKSSWPLLGPDMSSSSGGEGSGRAARFHLGPMYYYFQIASAKIFGSGPDKLAYPDLLFSVLSIPLFYFFLKKYFSQNLSLALTGLYAISFYSLKFSHSAWNPNSIPFFALLFLLVLLEILINGEKTKWPWIILAGIALGVGVQLHAILLVLFPAMAFFVFLVSMKKNRQVWKKWSVILVIVFILNLGQIVSEIKTNFVNSKAFMISLNSDNQNSKSSLVNRTIKNIDCHIQANAHIISSLGNKENCNFFITDLTQSKTFKNGIKQISKNPERSMAMFLALLFSIFGYVMVVINYKKEKDNQKKYFLLIIITYSALSFLVMLPVIDAALRYFIHVVFIPFIFLGLFINFLAKKFPSGFLGLSGIIFLFLAAANINSLIPVVKELSSGTRNSPNAIVLGEIEPMADYIMYQSEPQKSAYFLSGNKHANFLRPLSYVLSSRGFELVLMKDKNNVKLEGPVFRVDSAFESNDTTASGENIYNYKNFGQVGVYKLEN